MRVRASDCRPGATAPTRSPIAEMVDAYPLRAVRPRALGLVALTTIGVVVIGFPYLTFLPTLADERYDVGAGGYGLMAGVGRPRRGRRRPAHAASAAGSVGRRGGRSPDPGGALGLSLIALAARSTFWLALLVLLAVGASGLVFQTTTQSLMLTLSDIDYHGRMQSMVVLGFSGFGLAALPLGLLADAVTLEVTLAGDGRRRPRRHGRVRRPSAASTDASSSASSWRDRSASRGQTRQSTPGNVATQCSAMRPSAIRCTISHVTIERSPVSRLMPQLVARVHTRVAVDDPVVDRRLGADRTRWNSRSRPLYAARPDLLGARAGVADERIGEDLVDRVEPAVAPDVVPPALADGEQVTVHGVPRLVHGEV